jgi:hypothetical protein
MAQSINWLAFGMNSPEIKTNIHFFPYSGSISMTYPAELSITIFGQGLESLNVTMEGARLSQPDGLAIEKIFPALLSNYNGTFGLLIGINLNTDQVVDLDPSLCVVELRKETASVRYTPKSSGASQGEVVTLGLQSDKVSTTVLAVNCSVEAAPVGIAPGTYKIGKNAANQLEPYSVNEFSLSDDYISSGVHQNTTLGQIHAQKIVVKPKSAQTAYFALRKNNSGLPIAVMSL